jgi:hypothetical protein
MNNFKKLNLLLGVMLITAITSCSNEPNLSETESQSKRADWIKLGKKLENPYSIENMRLALKNLKAKKASSTSREVPIDAEFDVMPNYLYVQFQPQTQAEEAVLKQDSSVVLFDYPLDYEFTEEALDLRAELAPNEFPIYYSAIKIDSEIAGDDQYETLAQLYIPEEDPYFGSTLSSTQKISDNKEILLDQLLDEAFRLTGNKREKSETKLSTTAKWIFGRRWWPSGNISVFDEVAGMNKPVVGAQVLIRQWFTVRQGITDENGNFSTSSIRGSARYVLQWERYHYSIRNGSFFQAETKSSTEQKEEPWNLNITGGDDKYHALIHQAAHDYYYGHRFGLTSPPRNGIFKNQIKIASREINDQSSAVKAREIWFGAYISIKSWGAASEKVYGTTIHELAHAAHRELDTPSYNNIVFDAYTNPCVSGCNDLGPVADNNRRLLETWATTVETLFVLDRYRDKFGILNYSVYQNVLNLVNFQLRPILQRHYTSVGFDLIDNLNQRQFYNIPNLPVDRVNGYTITQLENALIGARSWWQWRDNLKSRFDNPTEQFVDELFNNWENQ